jgi:hypothetical protein
MIDLRADIETEDGYYHFDDGEITFWKWTGETTSGKRTNFYYVEGKKIPKNIVKKFIRRGYEVKSHS